MAKRNYGNIVILFDPRKKLHVYLIDLLGQIPKLGRILQGHGAEPIFAKKKQKQLFYKPKENTFDEIINHIHPLFFFRRMRKQL